MVWYRCRTTGARRITLVRPFVNRSPGAVAPLASVPRLGRGKGKEKRVLKSLLQCTIVTTSEIDCLINKTCIYNVRKKSRVLYLVAHAHWPDYKCEIFFPQYGRHEQRQQRIETGGKSESYQTRAFFSPGYSTQVSRRGGRQVQRMDERVDTTWQCSHRHTHTHTRTHVVRELSQRVNIDTQKRTHASVV